MDNFSLRPPGMMNMRVPTSFDTYGGKLEAQLDFGATTTRIGVDLQSNNREATLYSGPIPSVKAKDPAFARFYMWPDVTISQTGLYAESETELAARTTLKLGARLDHVRASAGRADQAPDGLVLSPNDFYVAQYGTTFDKAREEVNFGALARLEYEVAPGTTLFAGLSRAVRTADATERAMARNNWVGNPGIDPEKHYQLDVGAEMVQDDWSLAATVYADRVDDFILRDAYSVAGVTTYRNVDALLAGVDLSGTWMRDGFELSGNLAYTYGENLSDNRALAQIPPLTGSVTASYGQGAWRAGARVNCTAKQDRTDPSRDPGKTPGWVTLDLFSSYEIADNAVLRVGVDNVTDETYANHLSRANLFDTTLTQVNEPGRIFYARLELKL